MATLAAPSRPSPTRSAWRSSCATTSSATFGDPRHTGKPATGDIRQGKRTGLIAALAADGSETTRILLARAFGKADAAPADVDALIVRIESSGAKRRVDERIEALLSQAMVALERARSPPARASSCVVQRLRSVTARARPTMHAHTAAGKVAAEAAGSTGTNASSPAVSTGRAWGKVILLGEHAVVYGVPALAVGIDRGARATATVSAGRMSSLEVPAWGVTVAEDDTTTDLGRAFGALLAAARAVRGARVRETSVRVSAHAEPSPVAVSAAPPRSAWQSRARSSRRRARRTRRS